MTNTISASDANQRFSALLRDVQKGEDFIVMSRGRPVARVIPYKDEAKGRDVGRLVEELRHLPTKTIPNWTRDDLYS